MIGASAAALVLPLLSARPLAALTERAFAARFFTPAEFAMVDELSDLIIPTPRRRRAGAPDSAP
jgi:hypothetical protein